jgi:hypothetical protein
VSLANETDFGERVSVIRTTLLTSLNELQTIIDKSLPHAYAYSHVESERLRQQTRANIEAVRAVNAEEQVEELTALLRRHAAFRCGECNGTGIYLGEELRDGPCDACGGSGNDYPAEVKAVLAKVGP